MGSIEVRLTEMWETLMTMTPESFSLLSKLSFSQQTFLKITIFFFLLSSQLCLSGYACFYKFLQTYFSVMVLRKMFAFESWDKCDKSLFDSKLSCKRVQHGKRSHCSWEQVCSLALTLFGYFTIEAQQIIFKSSQMVLLKFI